MLEYCGEVLDHKEFKTRVKEYARNKNIHYYFMSLKNNEVSEEDMTHCNLHVSLWINPMKCLAEILDIVLYLFRSLMQL